MDDDEAEVWMSEFSIAMVNALNACESLVRKGCREIPDMAYDRIRDDQIKTSHGTSSSSSIDVVEFTEGVSPPQFLFRYIEGNRPCLIRGMDESFEKATQLWTKADNNGGRAIDRSWFLDNIQEEVPVRILLAAGKPQDLDSDGRATECETKFMTIEDWVSYLDATQSAESASTADRFYLKDWHFQLWLEQQGRQHDELYKVPTIFPRDLLNGFLNEFGIGDYRFVYWGPQGSSTSVHSDVMDSFSWSYNVSGTKLWTFFHHENDNLETGTIRQEQGELMFVPSGLKHSVINEEETISINHNWVPSAIVHKVWDCLERENKAVDMELAGWGMANHPDAQENMLRGCLGVNVTSYFFMILLQGLRLLSTDKPSENEYVALRTLGRVMNVVLQGGTERTIDVRARLRSQLGSDGKVESATRLALLLVSVTNTEEK